VVKGNWCIRLATSPPSVSLDVSTVWASWPVTGLALLFFLFYMLWSHAITASTNIGWDRREVDKMSMDEIPWEIFSLFRCPVKDCTYSIKPHILNELKEVISNHS
jgi:hypothetical protein